MPTDTDILALIDAAFGSAEKPEHFCDPTHCEECAEHDELLCTRDRATLRVEDVGNPGWDPICFSSPQGIAYYMPSLARLALDPPTHGFGWYGDQLLFHLYSGAEYNSFLTHCSPTQRVAVAALLSHFVESRTSLAERMTDVEELLRAHTIWSEA